MSDQLRLFEAAALSPVSTKKKTKISAAWAITDHACRHCGGRVLVRNKNDNLLARCAECGVTAVGDHTAVCCCGSDLGALGKVLECVKNPQPSKASPNQILVRERVIDVQQEQVRKSKPILVDRF